MLEFVSEEINKIREQQAVDKQKLSEKDRVLKEMSELMDSQKAQLQEQREEICLLLESTEKIKAKHQRDLQTTNEQLSEARKELAVAKQEQKEAREKAQEKIRLL